MSSAAWRSLMLTACALVALLEVWAVVSVTGVGGHLPWSGVLGWYPENAPYGQRITTVTPDSVSARAGIRPGDVIDERANSLQERYALSPIGRVLNGRPYAFLVQRGATQRKVVMTPAALIGRPREWYHVSIIFNLFADTALTLWLILFTAIIAWRRPGSQQMRLLATALFLYGANAAIGNHHWTTPWLGAGAARDVINDFAQPLAMAAWIALAGTFGRPLSIGRRILEWLGYCAAAAVAVQGIANSVGLVTTWYDWNLPVITSNLPYYALLITATFSSILAVGAAHEDERKRAAWILAPLAFLWLAPELGARLRQFAEPYYFWAPVLGDAQLAVQFLAPAALTYAALSRRVIDIGFAMSRSLAFALVSAIVVVTFLGVEWAAGAWFQGMTRTSSLVVGLIVALCLGLSLRFIHGSVDRFVDRVFFRKRHDDVDALRRFAHEAAFITDRATLLDLTTQEVREHTDAKAVSVLLFDAAARSYRSAGFNGERHEVGENDPGILALRAWHKPVEIHRLPSSALAGEYAFPMVARGSFVGVLVCGPKRDGEAYAPDEYEALRLLSDGVGAALDALERRSEESFATLREAIVAAITSSHEALIAELRARQRS